MTRLPLCKAYRFLHTCQCYLTFLDFRGAENDPKYPSYIIEGEKLSLNIAVTRKKGIAKMKTIRVPLPDGKSIRITIDDESEKAPLERRGHTSVAVGLQEGKSVKPVCAVAYQTMRSSHFSTLTTTTYRYADDGPLRRTTQPFRQYSIDVRDSGDGTFEIRVVDSETGGRVEHMEDDGFESKEMALRMMQGIMRNNPSILWTCWYSPDDEGED